MLAVSDVFLPLSEGLAKNRSLRTLKLSVICFCFLHHVAIILTHKQVEYVPPEEAIKFLVNAAKIPTLENLDIKVWSFTFHSSSCLTLRREDGQLG